jgi:hypothetical protein
MGRLTKGERRERVAPEDREDHGPPEFRVTEIGWDHDWAWCPICGAKPDGWFDDGTPRWSGGSIDCAVPDRRSGELIDRVAACRCVAGQGLHAGALGLAYFDQLPPATAFETRPLSVLWRRGASVGDPPQEQERPGSQRYNTAMGEQFSRQLRGQITRKQFIENAAVLEAKLMPERMRAPTIEDIMRSAALMALYYPTPKAEETGAEERAAAPYDGRSRAYKD